MKRPEDRDGPEYTVKRSDRTQMSWQQLCKTTGKNYHTFLHQVHKQGYDRLTALKKRDVRTGVELHMTAKQLCDMVGLPYDSFVYRRRVWKDFRKALLTPLDLRQSRKRSTCNEK